MDDYVYIMIYKDCRNAQTDISVSVFVSFYYEWL